MPLSPGLITPARPTPARPGGPAAARARKSQRLRALATVLALSAVMLIISAIGVAAALLRQDGSDQRAIKNLESVLRAAESIKRETSFTDATPGALMAKVTGIRVTAADVASTGDTEVSMSVSPDGSAWYGAMRSRSGRCLAAASINADPKQETTVLPVNCTGDAARAALMPLSPPLDPPTMVPATTASGSATSASG